VDFFSFVLYLPPPPHTEGKCSWEVFLHHFMVNSEDTSELEFQVVETASTHMLSRFGQLFSSGCQDFSRSVPQEHLASF